MVLNPSSDRSPTSRPKSTAVGVESAVTVLDPLLSVTLLMVMLNATTDETGASSPVTKTCDLLVEEELELELWLPPPPQPVEMAAISARTHIEKKRFMSNSYNQGIGEKMTFTFAQWKHNHFRLVVLLKDRLPR
jgi:hypothetical protein